jgi:hypothetical protein
LLNSLAELYLSLKKDVRVHKLSIKERIMLVFLKLKLDLTFVALGVLFGNISAPTCKAIFQTTVLVLTEILLYFHPGTKFKKIHTYIHKYIHFKSTTVTLQGNDVRIYLCLHCITVNNNNKNN